MAKQLKINFRNKQSKIIFGFLLLTISLFLLFSFNSFWFNWKTDDDIIISGWDFANGTRLAVGEMIGKVGDQGSIDLIKE